MRNAIKKIADSLEDLIVQLDDIDQAAALTTIKDYNSAVDENTNFDPSSKDGKKALVSAGPPKSNRATPIKEKPFTAYRVTFSYGGVAIDKHARVLDERDLPIEGLYAAGEMVGDIFHHNYPGGGGLTSGSVFGGIAGTNAAG